jgi:hypothetical protein
MTRLKIAMAVLAAALVLAGMIGLDLWRGLHAPGRALSAHFTADASRVVIVDAERSTRSRVKRVHVHDARTGAELARARLRAASGDNRSKRDECFDCIPSSGERVWCRDMSGDDGLGLRRLDTLALVADEARLHALAPALAGPARPQIGAGQNEQPMVDLSDGALLVMGQDGQRYRIDAELTARVDPPRLPSPSEPTLHMDDLRLPPRALRFQSGASGLVHDVSVDGRQWKLVEGGWGKRRTLAIVDRVAAPDGSVVRTPRPEQTFLEAGFLADPDLGRLAPVLLANAQARALVIARVELTGGARQLVLSRIDERGELAWSRALDDDQVIGARLVGDLLVVVLRGSLVGLDPLSGALRYRQAF